MVNTVYDISTISYIEAPPGCQSVTSSDVKLNEDNKRERFENQLLAAVTANLSAVAAGTLLGWTSPSLVYLESEQSHIRLDSKESSWVAALTPLAATVGPIAAGVYAERYGRKKSILFISLPVLISWGIMAVADSVYCLYLARIIAGLAIGWIFTVLPMYCGEIASDSVRGALGSLMQIFVTTGFLYDFCIGPYVSFVYLIIAASIIPVALVVLFVWMPESPYYLLSQNDQQQATKVLAWLKTTSEENVHQEMLLIQSTVQSSKKIPSGFKDLFLVKANRKALVLSCGLVGFQQLSGINAVLFFTSKIFASAGGSISAEVSSMIIGAVMLAASCVTPFVIDRLGRRALLMFSSVGMFISLVVLGLCYHLDTVVSNSPYLSYLPVVSLVMYICVYSVGFGPIPWAILGEVFPANIKSKASTVTASFCWLLGFFVALFFSDLVQLIGNDCTFWLFSVFCLLSGVFVSLCLPETKGKSLSDILEMLG